MTDTPLTSEAKIADLVRAGELSPEDARALKSALPGVAPPTPRWRLFVDPWPRLSERALLRISAATVLASAALAIIGGLRFDGALDLHRAAGKVALRDVFADQAAAWLLTALVFWLVSRAFGARARLIDLVLTTGAARLVLLLGGLLLAALPLPRDPQQLLNQSPVLLAVLAVAILPLLGWFVVLLYTGWRHATGLRAPRAGIGFALALVTAEVLSKMALVVASK